PRRARRRRGARAALPRPVCRRPDRGARDGLPHAARGTLPPPARRGRAGRVRDPRGDRPAPRQPALLPRQPGRPGRLPPPRWPHPSLTPFSGLSYKAAAFHAPPGARHPEPANRRVDDEDGDHAAPSPGYGLDGRRAARPAGRARPSRPARRSGRDATPHARVYRRADRHREGGGLGRSTVLSTLCCRPRPPAPLLPRAEVRPRHQALRDHRDRRRPCLRLARSGHAQIQPPVPRRGRGHLRLRAAGVERPVRGQQGAAARFPPLSEHRAGAGFAALGNRVSTLPGIPPGSPWEPGGLGRPNPAIRTVVDVPGADDVRGGGRFVFTAHDVTYTLAHYYTYLDTPGVRFQLPGTNP